jgi:glutathione synthase/RimK-type ligase-like ATP-grasp enzyme
VTARVCALVEAGSVPGRNPLLPPLTAALDERGVALTAWDPTGRFAVPPVVPDADLYLLKGDHPSVLTAAACLADAGAPLLNGLEASALVTDKARALARVAAAGVPVPASEVVGDRHALADALAGGPRIVKPVRGAHGEGVLRLGPGEHGRAGRGPWLVQEPVGDGGRDLKVYGVGTRAAVRAVRFSPGVVDAPREQLDDPPSGLAELGARAAAACGLTCWGADFLPGPDGPVLIDLNAFPGYRSVDEAPGWIADAVLAALAER